MGKKGKKSREHPWRYACLCRMYYVQVLSVFLDFRLDFSGAFALVQGGREEKKDETELMHVSTPSCSPGRVSEGHLGKPSFFFSKTAGEMTEYITSRSASPPVYFFFLSSFFSAR